MNSMIICSIIPDLIPGSLALTSFYHISIILWALPYSPVHLVLSSPRPWKYHVSEDFWCLLVEKLFRKPGLGGWICYWVSPLCSLSYTATLIDPSIFSPSSMYVCDVHTDAPIPVQHYRTNLATHLPMWVLSFTASEKLAPITPNKFTYFLYLEYK